MIIVINSDFIKNRIVELRLKKGVSEYEMSLALGKNRGYIQGISSGKALPKMREFLSICEYFNITPTMFFDNETHNPILIQMIFDGVMELNGEEHEKDLELLLAIIQRLIGEK